MKFDLPATGCVTVAGTARDAVAIGSVSTSTEERICG
jgi:hypothetical protein